MQHEWMLDVLADLRSYALSNGLAAVAEQLEDTRIVAMTEVASRRESGEFGVDVVTDTSGKFTPPIGASRRA